MSGIDAVQRATSVLTELLRKIAVPPITTDDGMGRVQEMHKLICRKLEPQLRQAVTVLQQMEGLEADRALLLSKGETKRAQEVGTIIARLMDSVEHEYYHTREKSSVVNHEQGFCSAVSAGASPAKRCLPTHSRTRTPDFSTPKLVKTKTGLTATPPASTSRRGRDFMKESEKEREKEYVSHASERSRSRGTASSRRRSASPPSMRSYQAPVSPLRPVTPVHQISAPVVTPTLTESPRRDREFIIALLRSLQLENYAHIFADMTLLSFYRLSYEQLSSMGLDASAATTLYNSIDQIKQIADTQVHSPGRSLT